MDQLKKNDFTLKERTFFRVFSLVLFTFFFILALRFVSVYLMAMSAPMAMAGLSCLAAVGIFSWFLPGYSFLLLVVFSPLAVGATNFMELEAAPVIEFGFCAVFLPWYIKKVLLQRVSLAPYSNIEFIVDMLAAVVVLSLIFQLSQYPLDYLLTRSVYPTVSGIEDPLWVLEASVAFLASLFMFRIILLEFRGCKNFSTILLWTIIAQSITLVCFAGYEIFEQINSGRSFDRLRLELPFTNPNPVAHYAVFFALFWLGMTGLRVRNAKWKNLLAFIPALLILLAIFITQSRTGWMAVLLTVSGLIFFKMSIKQKAAGIIFLILTVSTVQIFSNDLLESSNRYISRISSFAVVEQIPENRGLHFRMAIWGNALNAIAHNPAVGCGIGSYFRVSKYYQSESQQDIILPKWSKRDWGARGNAHNYYLQLGAELGLAGLILFLIIVVAVYSRGLKRIKSDPEGTFLLQGLLLGLTGLLLTGLTDHSLLPPAHNILVWFVLASIVVLGYTRSKRASLTGSKRLYVGSAIFCMILMTGYFVKSFSKGPEIFEYGFHPRYEKIDGERMRWVMPDAFTEVKAKADQFGIALYAEPENTEKGLVETDIYLNGVHADRIFWDEHRVIFKCYHMPGIMDETLEITLETTQSYNPYKKGVTDDIRKSRLQSLAVSDVQFFRIPVPEEVLKCQTIDQGISENFQN